ncbi:hypothetical protein F7Q99_30830 [Streptomyces kaniharaensis]|uniref:Type II secretion system protein GspF domain-containing protein n=1 Tax=Streptomyces kaniharaensis TaxID=212423 RepID=A0A6N7KXV6_9ACTN|nr:hypothetical protein [Streptomyces kaniharaensis]MQS16472.1 hypothetical protein [Streptomyces kaniharaensis]
MMINPIAVIGGALAGGGVALFVRAIVRPQPHLAATLDAVNNPRVVDTTELTQDERVGAWLETHLQQVPGVSIPRTNLALVGQSPGRFLLTKAALAFMGLLIPSMVCAMWAVAGLTMPIAVPVVVSLVLAALLWFVPDLALRDQAKRARQEFAHAISAYLELVALERAGDAGPAEALEKAAAVADSWAFVRLQQALTRARVDKIAPWESLRQLAAELDLPVLADVADIMRLSANDGAAVYTTLRSRAKSLRTELMAGQTEEANAASEAMTAPGAVMAVLVMALIAFPSIIRILNG